jgi:CTP:molybdopterin cytidylyltransferase MocA
MSRATEDLLDMLHGSVANSFLEEIKAFKAGNYLDKDGNPLPIPAALLAQAAKFLKDNGVDRAIRAGGTEDLLAAELDDEFGGNESFYPAGH